MLSCKNSNTLTKEKYQKLSQNLDNPKNRQTLEQGWALGHLPYDIMNEEPERFKKKLNYRANTVHINLRNDKHQMSEYCT